MIKKIDHLGIAVKSLDEAVPYYEKALGLKCEHREEVPSQKVRTAFFHCGEVHIELLEPTDPESPIAKYLEKKPGGIHHLCFRSDDIDADVARLKAKGYQFLSEEPAPGAHDCRVIFIHPKSCDGVLIELSQPPADH